MKTFEILKDFKLPTPQSRREYTRLLQYFQIPRKTFLKLRLYADVNLATQCNTE